MKKQWLAALMAAGSVVLTACGGDGGGNDDDDGGGTTPPAPTVNLTASPEAVTLGGSSTLTWTSTDATGCTASGAWTGTKSASGNEAVTPAAAGSPTYTLTCTGAGGSASDAVTLTVTAPPTVTGSIVGRVVDTVSGAQIEGASVNVGSVTTTTNASGEFTLEGVPVGERAMLEVTKTGYERNFRIAPVAEAAASYVSVVMLPVGATSTIDPAAGGDVAISGSPASVSFPANAIDSTGMVNVTLTDVRPSTSPDNMPGDFTNDDAAPIESFGALSVNLTREDGTPTNLRSGSTATIRIPVDTRSSTRPDSIPLFYFDTASGRWIEEGSASLQTGPDGDYYEGTVAHFTYWNADQVYNTVTVTGCVQDETGARVAGVRIHSNGTDYTGTSTSRTGEDGSFQIPVRSNSTLTLVGNLGAQVSSTRSLSTTGEALDITDSCLQLVSLGDATGFTVTLTWGETPSDLDSWLLRPEGGHISYTYRGSLTDEPFANLDVDDTDSFGPEVVTVLRPRVGTYRYFVNQYSSSPPAGITGSPARVELRANGLTQVFTPPPGENAQTRNWVVFDITVASDCTASFAAAQVPWPSTTPTLPQEANPEAPYCSE